MKSSMFAAAVRRLLVVSIGVLATVIAQSSLAQVSVFSRSDAGTDLWWNDTVANYPWFYAGGSGNQNRPDNPGGTTANWIQIGHNNNTTMTVNGAFFRIGSLEIASSATSARTYNSSDGGGWSFRTSGSGFTNNSTGNQTVNVGVGIDAATVVFRGNAVSTNTFNGSLFLNANTADFGGSASGSLFVVAGDVSGSGGSIIKTGDNTLVLSGNNSYTGGTDISNGVVRVNSNNGLGATNGGTTVRSGATLQLNNGISTAEAITLNGTGVGGTGSLRSTGLLNTNTGGITLGSSARIESDSGLVISTGAGTNAVGGTGFTLTVAGSANTTVTNTAALTNVLMMGAGGALVKEGSGTLTIGGNGNYTGGTTLTAGTLRISSSNSLGTGALSLNGGTFASANSGSRSFNHQLTIGGDVTFGEAANPAASLINFNTAALSLGGGARVLTTVVNTEFRGAVTNGSITKEGSAILTLANSSSDFGTLTINAGSVVFSNAARIAGLAGSGGLVLTNGALTVSNTASTVFSGAISGTAALSKAGAGTLTLSTAGTVSGSTTVNGGTLELQAQSAWGAGGTKTIGSAGTLRISGADQSYTNVVFSGSAATLDVVSGRKVTMERTSSANNAFTKTGAGTVELTGAGSYNLAASGQSFNFNEGTIILNRTGGNAAIGGDSANVNVGNGSANVTVRYGSAGDAAQGGQILQNNNINIANNGTLDLNGFNGRSTNVTMTGGLLTTGAGTLTFVTSATPLTYSGTSHQATVSGNVDLGGVNRSISVADGAADVDMVLNATIAGTGGGGLTKTGSGVLELAGGSANTYVGATVINNGTLRLNKSSGNAIAAGGSITNSATLLIASSDQVGDSVGLTLSGGTIAKGSGAITETLGALTLTATSFVDFGSGTGNFTFASYNPSSFKLTFQNFNLGNSLTVTSGTFSASEFEFNGFGYSWDTVPSGGFTITAIPEPSTALAALGLAGLLVAPRVRRWLKKA